MEKKILVLIACNLLLFFLSYKTQKHKTISNGLMVMASTLLTLLLIEFVYRVLIKPKPSVQITNPPALYKQDSLLGYKHNNAAIYNKINYFPGKDTAFNAHYTMLGDTINTGFMYNFRKGYKTDSSNREFVFMGCSIAFGEGLNDEQTLPWRYGKLANINTINLGCSGYGIHQVYELYQLKFATQNNRHRVFIYPFFYDHILRANGFYYWNHEGPFFEVQGDSLINKGPLSTFKTPPGARFAFYASCFGAFKVIKDNLEKIGYRSSAKSLKKEDFERCYVMLRKLSQQIAASGGKFIILNWGTFNERNSPLNDLPHDEIEKQLQALSKYGTQVIPVSSIIDVTDQRNFIPLDGHPTAIANNAIATWLTNNASK
jgi:hypothetical protein